MYTSDAVGRRHVVAHRRQCSLVQVSEHLPSPLITPDRHVERGVHATAQYREVDRRSLWRILVGKREEAVA
jgi:hypothetical protein